MKGQTASAYPLTRMQMDGTREYITATTQLEAKELGDGAVRTCMGSGLGKERDTDPIRPTKNTQRKKEGV
jgi:hypothetical protein